jgi:hypothetical protein
MARFILPRLASVACSALSVPRRSVCVAAEECDEPSPTTVSYLRRVIFSVTAEQAENTKYCDLIDFFCYVGDHQEIFFLWRPFLPNSSDDLVLEVAVAGSCDAIITYNKRHFKNVEKFGLRILDPKEFLIEIGVIS